MLRTTHSRIAEFACGLATPTRSGRVPSSTQVAFPSLALSQSRSLLRQIHQLSLADVGADAEMDIIQSGTDLAEFYQLSEAALALPKVEPGALSLEQATGLIDRPGDDDFLACGSVHIGVWGRRPPTERP